MMKFISNRTRFFGMTMFAAAMLGMLWPDESNSVMAQSPNAGYHVTICHRTGSASNPYVRISPNVEGVVKGHLDHDQTGNGLGGDIIPVFVYKGVTYSKNLTATFGEGMTGSQVIANGCFIPKGKPPTPTPTPTPTPPGMTPTPPPPPPPPTPPPTPPTPVPEPVTILLFGTGLASIGMAARRKLGWKGSKDNDISEK